MPRTRASAVIRRFASCHGRPSYSPEFTRLPSPAWASVIVAASLDVPSSATTIVTGRSYFRANSKSRSSWPGTPITAPVP